MKTKQKGYTLAELIFVIAFFAVFGLAAYVIVHFVSKFW